MKLTFYSSPYNFIAFLLIQQKHYKQLGSENSAMVIIIFKKEHLDLCCSNLSFYNLGQN